jgi:hypothetical protein
MYQKRSCCNFVVTRAIPAFELKEVLKIEQPARWLYPPYLGSRIQSEVTNSRPVIYWTI